MEEKNKIDERLKNEYAPFEDAAEEELDMPGNTIDAIRS